MSEITLGAMTFDTEDVTGVRYMRDVHARECTDPACAGCSSGRGGVNMLGATQLRLTLRDNAALLRREGTGTPSRTENPREA